MAAASRLVQMLDGKPKSRVLWSYLHFLLRDEARVLLSNSARASQVPAPHPPYQSWWEKHTQRMVLADPWLPQLERQRIE
ncbi:MAG: hypothetical protein FJ387_18470 [Verrucomicrobia bacterium]|nr:hypothetical protein [Verrucomicrobiota bacterium]